MNTWKRAPSAPYKTHVPKGHPKRSGCTPGTRGSVLERIVSWATDPLSPPIFWLSGMAGTGKSTIAFTICKLFDIGGEDPMAPGGASLGASFFCSRQVEALRCRQNIIPMIAYQLARHSRSFATELDKADRDATDSTDEQVEKLLVRPWKASVKDRPASFPLTLVVIDALDEIDDDEGEALLKELVQATNAIQEITRDGMDGFKILVTSRPHPSIVHATESLPVYRLEEIKVDDGRQDILTYLNSELPSLSKSDHDTIADHAQGLFIYAATVTRALKGTPKEQKAKLGIILGNPQQTNRLEALDALYKQVLNIPNLKDKDVSRLVVLHCIICASKPLPVSTIAQVAAGDSEDGVDEEATLRLVVDDLYSVLYISEFDKCVYTYHKSFSDFLLDSNRSGSEFACNPDHLHSTISMACFRIMQASLHFNMCNLPSSYLLDSEVDGLDQLIKENIGGVVALEYTCRYWSLHLVKVPIASENSHPLRDKLFEFSQEKILYWFEVMNLFKAKAECYAGVSSVVDWVNKQVGILLYMN
jgi:hypothetical protein